MQPDVAVLTCPGRPRDNLLPMSARPTVWVALLRGINVGRNHRVTMVDLRAAVAEAGGRDVTTHIQSGNVLLGHACADRAELALTLSQAFQEALGFPVPVILRTGQELADLVARCPFSEADWSEDRRRYVSFLAAPPAPDLLDKLLATDREGSSLYATPTEVCVSLGPESGPGYADVDRLLKVPSTARAWNVVEKLSALATRE
jgi:uncharacterized protein (DUF1697 family)